jgi:hypothetical protein
MLSVVMLTVIYAECRYADCRGAHSSHLKRTPLAFQTDSLSESGKADLPRGPEATALTAFNV